MFFTDCEGCFDYEIIIGGWGNTESVIKENKDDPNLPYLKTEVYIMHYSIQFHHNIIWGWFQTKDILSTEVFRGFWVEITEDATGLTIEVGKAEESAAFMSRTWLLGSEPVPWSDVRYVGFSSWRPGNDLSFNEIKFINPSNILLTRSCSMEYYNINYVQVS